MKDSEYVNEFELTDKSLTISSLIETLTIAMAVSIPDQEDSRHVFAQHVLEIDLVEVGNEEDTELTKK